MPKLTKASIDFPDTAPTRLSVEAKLSSSPEAVWNLITDNPSWVNWFHGVTSCDNTSDPSTGVGATRRIVVNGLCADEEFIAWEPERLWGFTVVETNRTFARRWVERLELEPLENAANSGNTGTLVRYSTGMELLTLAKIFRPIILRGIRRAWQSGLDNIDNYLR